MAQTAFLPLATVSGPKQARSERTLQRLLDAAEADETLAAVEELLVFAEGLHAEGA